MAWCGRWCISGSDELGWLAAIIVSDDSGAVVESAVEFYTIHGGLRDLEIS